MIDVLNLKKSYGKKVALNDVSFKVKKGEILGLLGPNGAGKSTTMNIMTGYIAATEGDVLVDGISILEKPNEVKKKIGYLPELPPLYLDMTVRGYLGFVYDLKKVRLSKTAHINEVCALVGIDDVSERIIKNLSKGYKQRVGLAAALLGNPDVLILDEPTVGLDPKQIIEIRNLIKSLSEKHTIILSSHILSEVSAVCDRVVVISHGKVVADDTPDNLSHHMASGTVYNIAVLGDEKKALDIISNTEDVAGVTSKGERADGSNLFEVKFNEGSDARVAIFNKLAENKMPIMLLYSTELTLEEVFLQLTEEDTVAETEQETVPETPAQNEETGGDK